MAAGTAPGGLGEAGWPPEGATCTRPGGGEGGGGGSVNLAAPKSPKGGGGTSSLEAAAAAKLPAALPVALATAALEAEDCPGQRPMAHSPPATGWRQKGQFHCERSRQSP